MHLKPRWEAQDCLNIYVLSLETAVKRRENVSNTFSELGIPFSFESAPNGKNLPNDVFLKHYNSTKNGKTAKRALTKNEIACLMGHRKIWQKIATGDAPLGLVLEDDFDFCASPQEFLDGLGTLSSSIAEQLMIKIDGYSDQGTVLGRVAGHDFCVSSRIAPRTTGYVLGRQAAQSLLRSFQSIGRPIDSEIKHYWEHNVPVLFITPQLVREGPLGQQSSIDSARNREKSKSLLVRFWKNFRYTAAMQINRMRHPCGVERYPVLSKLQQELAARK